MFSRFRVSSASDMNNKIFKFLCSLSGKSATNNYIKIGSRSSKEIYWFIKESQGLSVWITDIDDVNVDGSPVTTSPYNAKTTIGLASKYVKDMKRKEIDWVATNDARKALYEANDDNYLQERALATSTNAYKVAYDKWYHENERIENSIFEYKTVEHRLYGNNVWHVGCLLKYSEVTTSKSYKMLDCHYNEGTFMFSLFSPTTPQITRNIIVGDLELNNEIGSSYIIANSFMIHSEKKNVGHKDAFFLASVTNDPDVEEPIAGEDKIVTYDTELFQLVRADIDNEPNKNRYSVNGTNVSFMQSIRPVMLQIFDISKAKDTSMGVFAGNDYKLIEWFHKPLHSIYESEATADVVTYYPHLDGRKSSYELYDRIREKYVSFDGFIRKGEGGRTVNTSNNVSEIFPFIFYVLRDPEEKNNWSCIGHTNKINYVNMYNMGSGRITQTYYLNDHVRHANYNLWKRRPLYSVWKPAYNEEDKEFTEAYGFGGMCGLAFRMASEISLLGERWIADE